MKKTLSMCPEAAARDGRRHSLHTGAIVSSIAPRWGHAHDESEDVSHGRGCCFGSSLRHATSIRSSAWSADRLSDLSCAQVDPYGLRGYHEGITCSRVHSD